MRMNGRDRMVHALSGERRIGHPVPRSVADAGRPLRLPMSLTTLNDTIIKWLPARLAPGITLVPSGWEEWAQIDLLGQLHDTLGATRNRLWDVQRNVRAFRDPDRRADLVFNTETHDDHLPVLVVEILAEAASAVRADFMNRMHFEAEQLRPEHLAPGFAGARCMLLALTVDLATSTALQRHDFGLLVSTPDGCSAMWREVSERRRPAGTLDDPESAALLR